MDSEETIRPLDEDAEPRRVRLARKWLAYPEEIRKQVHDWKSLDALAHEELKSPSKKYDPIETYARNPTIIPFDMGFGYRKFSIRPKNIRAETVHPAEASVIRE